MTWQRLRVSSISRASLRVPEASPIGVCRKSFASKVSPREIGGERGGGGGGGEGGGSDATAREEARGETVVPLLASSASYDDAA